MSRTSIAIIGSGPTAVYSASYLLGLGLPLRIEIYESQAEAGKGTPYHQHWNDKEMLSNIASIELPPVTQSLVSWLESCTDHKLAKMGITREAIDERTFYPRVVLGEYYQAQLRKLIAKAPTVECELNVHTLMKVIDVTVGDAGIELAIRECENEVQHALFDYVIMATGHVWPKETQIRPGYFTSPWPATALQRIKDCHVGIRGTSLSAIDAAVALSVARGSFVRDEKGALHYHAEPGTEAFRISMMSRKGLLPEADFYYPLPYEPLQVCTTDAIQQIIDTSSRDGLLDKVFELFKEELLLTDPEYAEKVGLKGIALEGFCHAYFAEREQHDAFTWAHRNLEEAKANMASETTVGWRYAILRMHETIKYVVPKLNAADHQRFGEQFKPIFVDDYATVPHESIERMLALHAAKKLEVLRLGENYEIDTAPEEGGAVLTLDGRITHFPAFIEAMGQRTLTADKFPFPTLWRQGIVKNATAPHLSYSPLGQKIREKVEIGGIALDEYYHPVSDIPNADHLFCLSLPFLLGQFPFSQGVTSSHEMGRDVAENIGQQLTEITIDPCLGETHSVGTMQHVIP